MRALLIGLGGAGCRIVDTLNQHDKRSRVRSVRSFVLDADQKTLSEVQTIPREDRFILLPIDPVKEHNNSGTDFEVGNFASYSQRNDIEDIDAVFVCAGLGGRMAELVPTIVYQLNDAYPDPIFTILTLPGLNEGEKVSARASETLAEIRKVSQATILFDNETWFKRIEDGDPIKNVEEERHKATIFEMFPILNEMLARRVGLLLRAGELSHRGVEAAEVVLDAGEVLNTIRGMDLVAIGYATEKLPTTWTSNMMKRIRVERYLLEENQARTTRIVELAKQAVYQEISVPCDIRSSEKALVLIAGPSDELSMKGFHAVRKWIDRSIKGIEMRAGDYPVKSTQYVGVIVVLAGLENVPRVKELDEIRTIYENKQRKKDKEEEKNEMGPTTQVANDEVLFEDKMVRTIGTNPALVPEENGDDIFELNDFPKPDEEDIFQEEPQITLSPSYSQDDLFEKDAFDGIVAQSRPQYILPPTSAGDDDAFRNGVQRVISPPPSQQQYMYPSRYVPQYIHQPQPATIFDDPQPKTRLVIPKEKPRPKDVPQMTNRKKTDSVLSGKANVGSNGRPKETITTSVLEGSVTVGYQRPKETDGSVRISGGQRPKETTASSVLDGSVDIGTQRPKETDGDIRISRSQRPKEMDGVVRCGSSQRPKEIGESAKVRDVQKKREVNKKSIRVTSIPLPRNPATKEIAKKSEKDEWL